MLCCPPCAAIWLDVGIALIVGVEGLKPTPAEPFPLPPIEPIEIGVEPPPPLPPENFCFLI